MNNNYESSDNNNEGTTLATLHSTAESQIDQKIIPNDRHGAYIQDENGEVSYFGKADPKKIEIRSGFDNSDEQEQPEEEFTPCELCDGSPACEDFGCFLDIFSDKD